MRKNEKASGHTHFRSRDRIYCMNGQWYFQTREKEHGPYSSRETAEYKLKRYVSEMVFFDDVKEAFPSVPDWEMAEDDDDKEQRL